MMIRENNFRQSRPTVSNGLGARCNHPIALLVDPTEAELRELDAMLAACPNCSRWRPGDGPIMAILKTDENTFRLTEPIIHNVDMSEATSLI